VPVALEARSGGGESVIGGSFGVVWVPVVLRNVIMVMREFARLYFGPEVTKMTNLHSPSSS
jgi:hypothetical protein